MNAAIAMAVVFAGAGGAVLRYLVSRVIAKRSSFPWGVLVVNVVGSAIGGLTLGLSVRFGVDAEIQLIVMTGLCGGLTTFSTLSVETIQLFLADRRREAVLSSTANLTLGIGAAAFAYLATILWP